MKKYLNKEYLFLIVIIALFLKLETYLIYKGMFAYTYDQGRDLLEAAKIAYEGNLTFIGPTTGLPGIFYGPWWYYLLAILVKITGGNPTSVAIIFSFIGLATVISLYFFLKKITKTFLLPAFAAVICLISPLWMLAPTFMWSPTLVPISIVLLFYSFVKIIDTQKARYYFIYGFASQLILNGEVAFGVMCTLWVIISLIIFKKQLINKKTVYIILGMFILWIPQILFEFKNGFLEINAISVYLQNPKVYGEEYSISARFIQRLEMYLGIIAETFFKGNRVFTIGFLAIFACFIFVQKRKFTDAQKTLTKYLVNFVVFALLFFSMFKDRVWDYYLIGLPITFVIIFTIFASMTSKKFYQRKVICILLTIIIAINLPSGLLKGFNEKTATDGGAYINAKRVIDNLSKQKPTNYSLYVFSPAIFDPPFDYLVYWYNKKGILETPQTGKNNFYLIIREYASKKYLTTGWYGDKTKDKSTVNSHEEFIGDIVLEKHNFR